MAQGFWLKTLFNGRKASTSILSSLAAQHWHERSREREREREDKEREAERQKTRSVHHRSRRRESINQERSSGAERSVPDSDHERHRSYRHRSRRHSHSRPEQPKTEVREHHHRSSSHRQETSPPAFSDIDDAMRTPKDSDADTKSHAGEVEARRRRRRRREAEGSLDGGSVYSEGSRRSHKEEPRHGKVKTIALTKSPGDEEHKAPVGEEARRRARRHELQKEQEDVKKPSGVKGVLKKLFSKSEK